MAWIAPVIGTVGSLVGGNAQKNAQKASSDAQQSLDKQLEQIYSTMLAQFNEGNASGDMNTAANFYAGEVQNGLDPAVTAAANANLAQQQAQGIAAFRNSLGSATPNVAGTVKDMQENNLQSDVLENINLAGQNQAARQQGASGLTGIAGMLYSLLGGAGQGIAGIANQYAGANSQAASSASNPFSSLATLFANPAVLKALGLGGSTTAATTTAPATGLTQSALISSGDSISSPTGTPTGYVPPGGSLGTQPGTQPGTTLGPQQ